MQLSSLSVAELAALVDDVYMADQGDDASRFGQDHQLLKQLHAHLVESPLLADEVLRCWLDTLGDTWIRRWAAEWFDHDLLTGALPR